MPAAALAYDSLAVSETKPRARGEAPGAVAVQAALKAAFSHFRSNPLSFPFNQLLTRLPVASKPRLNFSSFHLVYVTGAAH
jgi:hypothetical protein